MKKKLLKYLLIFLLSFGIIYTRLELVKADSGFDYDYDSGSSGSSGSSWGSSGSSNWRPGSSSHSNGGSGTIINFDNSANFYLFLISCIALFCFIYIVLSFYANSKKVSSLEKNKDIDITKITNISPNFDDAKFKWNAFTIFKTIETALMNLDANTIRNLTTDEIYSIYNGQIKSLKAKGQKNIIKDLSLRDIKITDIQELNNIITINVYLKVECYNYIINDKTHEILRGSDNEKATHEYNLSFVNLGSNNKIEKCPNCGAPIKNGNSKTCDYCDSILINNDSSYIMSKKTNIK